MVEIKENNVDSNNHCDNINLKSKSTNSFASNGVCNNHINEEKSTADDEVKVKKKVNIFTEEPTETTALRKGSEASNSFADKSTASNCTENCVTMTGTVKRGKKAGQNLDVKLNISREELEMLDANIAAKQHQSPLTCNVASGPHVIFWSIVCLPFAVLASSIYSFYMGTLMWYNIFTYVTEEVNLLYRILFAPLLILFYPLFIVLCTLSLGLYAGFVQVSWFFDTWQKEFLDYEKGFYGWLCSTIHLEDCSPYEVIVLTDIQMPSLAASQDTLAG